MTTDPVATLNAAMTAFQQGRAGLADVLCETLLWKGQRYTLALAIVGAVASRAREFERAVGLLTEASRQAPDNPTVRTLLDEARKGLRETALLRPDGRRRVLVIKAWGYGFCSDLDHVLGGLLVAELSGRVPIVHWGAGSLFRDEGDENAWPRFFAPVSKLSLEEVVGTAEAPKPVSYYPPKWNAVNIREGQVNQFEGPGGRTPAFMLLSQREDVAVSDFHASVAGLAPWIRPNSPFAGKPLAHIYRTLVQKYLRPSAEVTSRVEAFAQAYFNAPFILGVHARGGDKPVEDPELMARNKETPALVDGILAKHPQAKIFLLTDDTSLAAQYAARYGDRLITTDCTRTSSAKGVHYHQQESRTRLGIEVLVDMYLATRCHNFIGVGSSNVSAMIDHLKDWGPGTIDLRPSSTHYKMNPYLYGTLMSHEEEQARLAEAQATRNMEGPRTQ